MAKTYQEINEKIRKRQAVVLTADEILHVVEEKGYARAAEEVDVVTTGTFGAMCSSGAFLNFGHATPRIRATKVWLNEVEAYAGIAAVDCYIGATQRKDPTPVREAKSPQYGGGHVIEDLVSGKTIHLKAESDGSDCYPNHLFEKDLKLETMPDAFFFSPRNGYQNYACAVNASDKTIYTYMGVLKPKLGNATYSGAGQLSPLMNDPLYRTVGVGTRIFLGGGVGFVTGPGTQHNPRAPRTDRGIPRSGSGTLAVTGNLKAMSSDWLKGVFFRGYGVTLRVGLGIPIPILDEEMLRFTAVRDEDIPAPVIDYSSDYPNGTGKILGEVTVAEIRRGQVQVEGRSVPASNLSDIKAARRIAGILKLWIEDGGFMLGEPVELLPPAS